MAQNTRKLTQAAKIKKEKKKFNCKEEFKARRTGVMGKRLRVGEENKGN